MQDRFKFRVWAKPHEPTKTEGYYVDDADYMVMTSDGKVQIEYYCDNGYAGYIDSFEQDEIVVEQCTGLKDKNGKLIYEGDIVKNIEQRIKVIFDEQRYCFMFEYQDTKAYKPISCIDVLEDSNLEVIDNIHENEELLK